MIQPRLYGGVGTSGALFCVPLCSSHLLPPAVLPHRNELDWILWPAERIHVPARRRRSIYPRTRNLRAVQDPKRGHEICRRAS